MYVYTYMCVCVCVYACLHMHTYMVLKHIVYIEGVLSGGLSSILSNKKFKNKKWIINLEREKKIFLPTSLSYSAVFISRLSNIFFFF